MKKVGMLSMQYPSVFLLSDSVGETAELVMKAGLSQFTNKNYKIKRIPYVDSKQVIDDTLEQIMHEDGLVGFTLVDPELRNYMNERAAELEVDVVDIMGPMMKAMERLFTDAPRLQPGLIYKLDQDYFKRIEAI